MGYFAVGGVIAVWLLGAIINFRQLMQAIRRRRERQKFQEFEDALLEPDGDPLCAQKFFSEDVLLAQEVTILITEFIEYQELVDRYQVPLVAALHEAGVIDDTRAYTMVDVCGIDMRLNNFVSGMEILRSMLIKLEVPRGTLIEYSGGDLPVYES